MTFLRRLTSSVKTIALHHNPPTSGVVATKALPELVCQLPLSTHLGKTQLGPTNFNAFRITYVVYNEETTKSQEA